MALACGTIALASVQPPPPGGAPAGLRTDHAHGYYDAKLRRAVLIGGIEQARAGQRDQAWIESRRR